MQGACGGVSIINGIAHEGALLWFWECNLVHDTALPFQKHCLMDGHVLWGVARPKVPFLCYGPVLYHWVKTSQSATSPRSPLSVYIVAGGHVCNCNSVVEHWSVAQEMDLWFDSWQLPALLSHKTWPASTSLGPWAWFQVTANFSTFCNYFLPHHKNCFILQFYASI